MELNSREIAILLWGGGLLLWASWKSKDLRKSLGGVLRAVSHHKILIPCAIAGAYAAACVILLWKFGFWEPANLKTTLLWLLTFAFVTMGEVVQSEHGVKKLKAVVKDTLSATAVVLFIGTIQGLVMQSLLAGDVVRMRAQAPAVFAIYRRGIGCAQ